MPAILFVCQANLFRSPLAAACLRQIVQRDYPRGTWQIGSAGTWVQEGMPAPPVTLKVAQDLQLPGLQQHVARPVTEPLLQIADLILTMESGQREALRYEFPSAAPNIHQLSVVVDQMAYDIPDPNAPGADPENIGRLIYQLIRRGSAQILSLAKQMQLEKQSIR